MENNNQFENPGEDLDNPTSVNDAPGNGDVENNFPVEDELIQLKKELEAQKDKYLRLVAEFDNFKRRNAKERVELIQTAGKDVILSMLDVLDDCDRAEKQINTDAP